MISSTTLQAIIWLPKCQWRISGGMGKMCRSLTTTKHIEARPIYTILGMQPPPFGIGRCVIFPASTDNLSAGELKVGWHFTHPVHWHFLLPQRPPSPLFVIIMQCRSQQERSQFQDGNASFHCKDNTVARPSYIYNGDPHTGKSFLYWNTPCFTNTYVRASEYTYSQYNVMIWTHFPHFNYCSNLP